jgi:hypothetical protein
MQNTRQNPYNGQRRLTADQVSVLLTLPTAAGLTSISTSIATFVFVSGRTLTSFSFVGLIY